jgi:hypothetical protein
LTGEQSAQYERDGTTGGDRDDRGIDRRSEGDDESDSDGAVGERTGAEARARRVAGVTERGDAAGGRQLGEHPWQRRVRDEGSPLPLGHRVLGDGDDDIGDRGQQSGPLRADGTRESPQTDRAERPQPEDQHRTQQSHRAEQPSGQHAEDTEAGGRGHGRSETDRLVSAGEPGEHLSRSEEPDEVTDGRHAVEEEFAASRDHEGDDEGPHDERRGRPRVAQVRHQGAPASGRLRMTEPPAHEPGEPGTASGLEGTHVAVGHAADPRQRSPALTRGRGMTEVPHPRRPDVACPAEVAQHHGLEDLHQ